MKPIIICLCLLAGSAPGVLSAQLLNRVANARILYDEDRHEFYLTGVASPPRAAGSRNAAHWTYFWEFGDGHYSTAVRPKYCYPTLGTKTVRVSLAPHYSHARSETVTQFVRINSTCASPGCRGLGACGEADYATDGLVHIDTDANNELVPNNDVQVVVHYAMPATAPTRRGKLFILYNEASLRKTLGFPPLQIDIYDDNRHRLFDATPLVNPKQAIDLGGVPYELVRKLRDEQGYGVLGYSCQLDPGRQQRLFLTLRASASLDTTVLKGKKAALTTTLKAIWVPEGYRLPDRESVATYPLKMLSVHDPNRLRILRPAGKATYVRNLPERFEVEVEYQNLGGRPAQRVELLVPWPENLDPRSVAIQSREPDRFACRECPEGPRPDSDTSCFQLDTTQLATRGPLRMIFHNIFLHGKRESGIGGGKYTKGKVVFTANSNNRQRQTTPLYAEITFDRDEIFRTGSRAKRWRHHGVGLKLGYNFSGAPEGYEPIGEEWRQYYNLGAFYRRSALVRGFTPFAGGEITLSGQGFRADRQALLDDQLGTLLLSRETVQQQSLDVLATTEVRVGGLLALGAGAGLSIPLWAQGTIQANPLSYEDLVFTEFIDYYGSGNPIPPEVFSAMLALPNGNGPVTETSAYGLFDDRGEVLYFNEPIDSRAPVGGLVALFAEAGLLNNVALGFRQNFRIYPNGYKGQCLKSDNLEVYLRVKLFSLR